MVLCIKHSIQSEAAMSWTGLLVALTYGLLGAALLFALWPTEQSGSRFLRRWGINWPSRQQSTEAARYLRQRRVLYPVLFLLTPPALAAAYGLAGLPDSDAGVFRLLAPVLGALLLAELVAAIRPRRGVRVAALRQRSWRDLLPRWSPVMLLALAVLAVLLAGAGLLAQPWADRLGAALPPNDVAQPPTDWRIHVSEEYRAEIANSDSWVALAGAVVCLLAVLGLVRLVVRRPAVADAQVDAALRTRSARVAVGIGIAWLSAMVNVAVQRLWFLHGLRVGPEQLGSPAPGWLARLAELMNLLSLPLMFAAIVGWIWVANPPRRQLDRQATR
jgi:hypothetical protein